MPKGCEASSIARMADLNRLEFWVTTGVISIEVPLEFLPLLHQKSVLQR